MTTPPEFLKENEKVSICFQSIDFLFLICIIQLYKGFQKNAMFFRWKQKRRERL